jgi:hypothetical protein
MSDNLNQLVKILSTCADMRYQPVVYSNGNFAFAYQVPTINKIEFSSHKVR